MLKRFWKGLRAIEIVIMIMLVTMLVGIVYFRYEDFACRSMQSEAKFSLQEILNAQLLYHAEFDYFSPLEKLLEERRVVLSQKYYDFFDASKPGQDNFTVLATGRSNTLVAGEVWSIDDKKRLLNLKSVCKKP
jgi:Tfp pilus assembly protein PilE